MRRPRGKVRRVPGRGGAGRLWGVRGPLEPARRARLAAAALVAIAAMVSAPGPGLSAHEAGTTRVVASFAHDGGYTVDVTTDAAALLARLQVARHEPRTAPASADAFQRALDRVCADVAAHVGLSFDGRPSDPALTCTVDGPDAASGARGTKAGASSGPAPGGADVSVLGVTVTARGVAPAEARTFRLRYDLTLTRYALDVRTSASTTTESLWLDGGEESAAIPIVRLAPPVPPVSRWSVAWRLAASGFTRVLPGGIVPVLLVWAICLGRTRFPGAARDVALALAAGTAGLGALAVAGGAAPWRASLVSAAGAVAILCVLAVAASNVLDRGTGRVRTALLAIAGLVLGISLSGPASDPAAPASPLAVLAFACGVDAALSAVAIGAVMVMGTWSAERVRHRRLIGVPGSALVVMLAILWTIERVAGAGL